MFSEKSCLVKQNFKELHYRVEFKVIFCGSHTKSRATSVFQNALSMSYSFSLDQYASTYHTFIDSAEYFRRSYLNIIPTYDVHSCVSLAVIIKSQKRFMRLGTLTCGLSFPEI